MGHQTSKSYHNLQKRLDAFPQGAPSSPSLLRIFEVLFTEQEAELISTLPLTNQFTVDVASGIWKKTEDETKEILEGLAAKGIFLYQEEGEYYFLAPPMAGFFEFSLMRTDGKFDRKLLSELYYQYINVEEDFMKHIFGLSPTIARSFVQEDQLDGKTESIILDYERASHIIDTATCITVGTCYCRHKMEHMGKACENPQDVCLTLNHTAKSLAKFGIAREISQKEAHHVLDRCVELGLVQIGDNVQEMVNWICNCCACCCEGLLAYRELGYAGNRFRNSFQSVIVHDECTACGICEERCPVDAITIRSDNGSAFASVDGAQCIGCGVCCRFCPSECIHMERIRTEFVPKDSLERILLNAISTNRLGNLLFPEQNGWKSRFLRNTFRGVFGLTPAKYLLANRRVQEKLLRKASRGGDYSHPEL